MERTYCKRSRKPSLTESIRTWRAAMGCLETREGSLDQETSNAERLEIARGVKLFLGDGHYAECWPFRDFSIGDVGEVELEAPAFLTGRSR